jgi:hypothetical protein
MVQMRTRSQSLALDDGNGLGLSTPNLRTDIFSRINPNIARESAWKSQVQMEINLKGTPKDYIIH